MKTITRDIQTGIYGVLGHQIGYSQSPHIFRSVFDSLSWPAVYALFDLPPQDLSNFLRAAPDGRVRGLSVTKPYKLAVMTHLDRVDSVAKSVGAVNTIAIRSGKLTGYNTDVDGVTIALSSVRKQLRDGRAIIFGAGGAARAVAYTLRNEFGMSEIVIAARNAAKARLLARQLDVNLTASTVATARFAPHRELHELLADTSLIVNATPLGGSLLRGKSPLPARSRLSKNTIVFDLNYIPSVTLLMKRAKLAGCRQIIGGWPMLVAQADSAFRLWTGRHFPHAIYRQLLRQLPKP